MRDARARSPQKAGADLSAVVSVGTKTTADTFRTTIAALRIDLETHRHRVGKIETLIAALSDYLDGATPRRKAGRPPLDDAARRARAREKQARRRARIKAAAATAAAPAPPKAGAKRQRRKASAAAKSDAPQDQPQPHGGTNMPDGTQDQVSALDAEGKTVDVLRKVFDEQFTKIFEPEPKIEEPAAAGAPPAGVAVEGAKVVSVPKPCKRKPQRLPGWTPDGNAWRQPTVTVTETTDEAGIVTRIRTTEGERPPLLGERPQV